MFLNEVESNDILPNSDPFKTIHIPQKRKSEVIGEFPQNKKIIYTHRDPNWGVQPSKISWTNEEYDLRPKKFGT